MMHQEPTVAAETLLREWLQETEDDRAQTLLGTLVSRHAAPLIRRIVTYKLRAGSTAGSGGVQPADVDDVYGTAVYNLMAHLRRLKDARMPAVHNFTGYAAVTAHNVCNEYFRARKPAWLSLSMRIRYVVTHAPAYAMWEMPDGREVCGFTRDRDREPARNLVALSEAAGKLRRSVDPSRLVLADLIEAILKAAHAPMIFEELVSAAAEWSGLQESRVRSLDDDCGERGGHWEQLSDGRQPADTQLMIQDYMKRLWNEILQLSLEHRKALLLNLNHAAGGDIQLFDWLGIASVRQIAAALEMSPAEFAQLWKDLPLDDARIALELGISRQDVANRRSAARKRLARRMKETQGAI